MLRPRLIRLGASKPRGRIARLFWPLVVCGSISGAFIAPIVISQMIISASGRDRIGSTVSLVGLAVFSFILYRNIRYYANEEMIDIESCAAILGSAVGIMLIIYLWPHP